MLELVCEHVGVIEEDVYPLFVALMDDDCVFDVDDVNELFTETVAEPLCDGVTLPVVV